ncbi:glycoside hydrolase family 16 protein [Bacillus badius]|uniref:glycoside hydrolase family 16 protein n=1 Tax=Bacillus badius TaxID=1455 RepID=UPI001CBC567A|nr:glycoside hydrolase family 16 protein [Bacillus badius]UAT32064.1 glycoside hydrolase family 16 protein [Bacillus badius]
MKKKWLLASLFLFMIVFSVILLLSLKERTGMPKTEREKFTPSTVDTFQLFNRKDWEIREKFKLGRGYLLARQVAPAPGKVEIKLNSRTADGGEIRTRESFQYGQFEAVIQTADAPGSITGFFLYAPPDLHHEIDIEIFNERKSKVLLTIYQNGKVAKQMEHPLPFDPTKELHHYRIDVLPEETRFLIDGELIQAWKGNFSSKPMQLMINSWYPSWLEIKRDASSATVIDQVSFSRQ